MSEGGRVFFARTRRAPDRDTEIRLVSVGVDIGSSTSHLAFSRLVLQRHGRRTHVLRRELLHESDILLTPYASDATIDTNALGRFIGAQYESADIYPEMIDTGALVLTGLAARTENARAIGELFAGETGRFVAVAAGDGLETALAAHGSGAVAASAREGVRVMNIDIGGGTSKIAICENGAVTDLTAIDIGARLILLDAQGRVSRVTPAGWTFANDAGVHLMVGEPPPEGALAAITERMAIRLLEACGASALSEATRSLLLLPSLRHGPLPAQISFSGGVAEFIHGREPRRFGDLGPLLADAVLAHIRRWGPALRFADAGIRATVIGASQHSVQLSGNTIFIDPTSMLPLQNVPVICPDIDWTTLTPGSVISAIEAARHRMSLPQDTQVAIAYRWQGDATHDRISAFCRGLHALPSFILVGDGDVGGLLGLHLRETQSGKAIVSIDGIIARELDFIDIGEILHVSGGVPVVVKSLVFPAEG